jgi:hypothetical protein
MRVFAASLLLAAFVFPAHAQFAQINWGRCAIQGDCDAPPSAPDAPFGYAAEDWSLRYASGRSHLSTLVPMALGSMLLRVHEARGPDASLRDPLGAAALALATTGAVIGPSMGEWCLGGDCARRSWLPLGVRIAGVGEVAWAVQWARRRADRDETLGAAPILVGSFLALPGFIALVLGIGWSFRNAPRLRCSAGADASTLSVAPAASADGSGSGLALRLTL